MKKIIGYFLLALALMLLYVGETLIFVFWNCHWAVIVFAPLGTFVGAALVVGVSELIGWLIAGMKTKKYLYAISFFHSQGNGCWRNKKINSYEEFEAVRNFICKENNLTGVAIINIMLICKERR